MTDIFEQKRESEVCKSSCNKSYKLNEKLSSRVTAACARHHCLEF